MGAPFLVADTSSNNGRVDWSAVAAFDPMVGVILKATEGVAYRYQWFLDNWGPARAAGGARYGFTWLRGAYHLMSFHSNGRDQADAYLDWVEKAGGWGWGDMLPFLDVESAAAKAAGPDLVVETVTAWCEHVTARTGRDVILYSPYAKWTDGIASRMGASRLWTPNYGPTMAHGALGVGPWSLSDVALWQYTNGTDPGPSNLPVRVPGVGGPLDLSVVIAGNRQPTLLDVHYQLRMNRLDLKLVAMLAGAAAVGATMT